MSLLSQEYSAHETFQDVTGHYYNFGTCNPFTSFLYMVFMIKILGKIKVNKNMQQILRFNYFFLHVFFYSLFIITWERQNKACNRPPAQFTSIQL